MRLEQKMPPAHNKKKRKQQLLSSSPKTKSSPSVAASVEPYPDHSHPTPEECLFVRDALLSLHGFPKQFDSYRTKRNNKKLIINGKAVGECSKDEYTNAPDEESVLDGLISTLLSQNTTDVNSARAFQSLKSTFPTWEQVIDADPKYLENAIRCGGLAATKATRIKNILKSLREKTGKLCLEYLRGMSVNEVKDELTHFKGIGPKTVACVLMFQLQQEDFPVDTHVFRITKAMGWIPMKADLEKAYLHLNKRIPDELKFDLNCLLVSHGKLCDRCVKKRGNLQPGNANTSCPLQYVTVVVPDRE